MNCHGPGRARAAVREVAEAALDHREEDGVLREPLLLQDRAVPLHVAVRAAEPLHEVRARGARLEEADVPDDRLVHLDGDVVLGLELREVVVELGEERDAALAGLVRRGAGPSSWTCDSSSARRRSSSSADSLSISSATAGSSGHVRRTRRASVLVGEDPLARVGTGLRGRSVAATSFAAGSSAGGSACVVAGGGGGRGGGRLRAGRRGERQDGRAGEGSLRIGLIAPRGRAAGRGADACGPW